MRDSERRENEAQGKKLMPKENRRSHFKDRLVKEGKGEEPKEKECFCLRKVKGQGKRKAIEGKKNSRGGVESLGARRAGTQGCQKKHRRTTGKGSEIVGGRGKVPKDKRTLQGGGGRTTQKKVRIGGISRRFLGNRV